MRLVYGTTTISEGDQLAGAVPRMEGAQTVGRVAGAASVLQLGRGDRVRRLPLTIPHHFDTLLEAEEFWASHYDSLEDAATLSVICGYDVTRTWTADAVLENISLRIEGPAVVVEYSFLVGPFTLAA